MCKPMPVMDGWEATERIKATPTTRHIPAIALTTHAMMGEAGWLR
jgi:CheY-like chemotaxis protein